MQTDDTPIVIYLSKGFKAVISRADAVLTEHKWSACVGLKRTYAFRAVTGNNKVKIYLGRAVLARKLGRDLEPGESCRFKNGNPLDCTRDNVELLKKNVRSKTPT